MHEFPPASVHVKRHLSPRERGTIAVALSLLADLAGWHAIERARGQADYYDDLLSNEQAVALARELTEARKVKVCRSKEKPA